MKKALSLFLSLILILGTVAVGGTGIIAFAEDTSGLCGYNAAWKFDKSTGTLTIWGNGPIGDTDDEAGESSPWSEYKDLITTVIIEDGITRIGQASFVEHLELKSVSIPSSVESIGNSAFFQCSSLESITIPGSVSEIEMIAFYLCSSLSSITILYTGNDMKIGEYAFEGIDASTVYGYAGSSAQTLANAYGFNFVSLGDHVHNHTATITTPATCSAEGVMTFTCSCGDSYTQPISKTSHTDSNSDGKCDACGADVSGSTEHVHSYNGVVTTQQTCSSEGLMTYTCSCGDTYTKAIPAHFKGEPVIISTYQELTCTQDGAYICKVYCTECGVEIKDALTSDILMVVYATGHNIEKHEAKAPTCTEVGWEAYEACTKCDYTTCVEIPKTEHSFTNYVSNNDATSTADGTKTAKCDNCDETDTIPDEGSKLSHTHVPGAAVKENEVAASASADGSYDEVVYCTECEAEISRNKITVSKFKSGKCGDNLTWVLDNDGNLTISGTGEMDNYNSYSVLPWDSCKANIKVVRIEDGVTDIGSYAFYNCTNLEDVTIPDSVTRIGESAFSGTKCYDNSDNWEGDTFFVDNNLIMAITFSDTEYTVKDGTRVIADGAFWGSYIESITIPDSVTGIGYSAFSYTHLKNITIPDSVTKIYGNAFSYCESLESVTIGDGVTSIGEYAFSNCPNLKSVTIGKGVTSIDVWAFYNCSNLSSVTIPGNVKSIDGFAFQNCANLKSVTIENGVTSIDEYAFYGCSELAEVTIPDSVTYINDSAFEDCSPNLVISCNCNSYANSWIKTHAVKSSVAHSFTNYVSDNNATCTADGTKTAKCDRCDETDTIAAEGTAKGHKIVNHDAKAPTCTDIGWDAYQTCENCDYTTYTEIEATGHDFVDLEYNNDATCTEDGTKTMICANTGCNETKAVTVEGTAKGHTPAPAVEENRVEPTCTKEGSYDSVVYCKDCKTKLSSEEVTIEALGHTKGEPVKTNETPATCTSDGVYYLEYSCSVCKVLIHTEEVITDALGHKKADAVKENEKAATCTEDGSYDEVIYCSECGEKLSSEAKTITASGHTADGYSKETVTKPATCTGEGAIRYDRICNVCGEVIDSMTGFIPATGHTEADAVRENEKAATCTEDGSYDEVIYCSECGEKLSTEAKTIPATGHKDKNKDGKCDVCGVVTDENLVNPCRNAKINVAAAKTVNYRTKVKIKATATNVPKGYYLAIYVNGKQVAKAEGDGKSTTEVTYDAGQIKSDISYTVKIVDAKGNVQKDANSKDLTKDGGKITCNKGFFKKLIALFKAIFRILPSITIKP